MNNKQQYIDLINAHKQVLEKSRKLISILLDKLESEIAQPEAPEKTHAKFWWGEKECATSILVKLTTILLKLVPLELEIAKTDFETANLAELDELAEDTKIAQEDLEILQRYTDEILKDSANL